MKVYHNKKIINLISELSLRHKVLKYVIKWEKAFLTIHNQKVLRFHKNVPEKYMKILHMNK